MLIRMAEYTVARGGSRMPNRTRIIRTARCTINRWGPRVPNQARITSTAESMVARGGPRKDTKVPVIRLPTRGKLDLCLITSSHK